MSQKLQKIAKFQKIQLANLVDFEKCCKTHISLQKSVPIQPKTNNILPKFCQKLAITELKQRDIDKLDATLAELAAKLETLTKELATLEAEIAEMSHAGLWC